MLQLRITALFYLENSRKIHPRGVRAHQPKDGKRRAPQHAGGRVRDPRPFGSSFSIFFLPLGLAYVNWASQECCLFYLRSSLWSSHIPLFYFLGLFPSLSFFLSFFFNFQYCIGFAIYQNESAIGIHVFPILNPPPSSLPIPSLPSLSFSHRHSGLLFPILTT